MGQSTSDAKERTEGFPFDKVENQATYLIFKWKECEVSELSFPIGLCKGRSNIASLLSPSTCKGDVIDFHHLTIDNLTNPVQDLQRNTERRRLKPVGPAVKRIMAERTLGGGIVKGNQKPLHELKDEEQTTPEHYASRREFFLRGAVVVGIAIWGTHAPMGLTPIPISKTLANTSSGDKKSCEKDPIENCNKCYQDKSSMQGFSRLNTIFASFSNKRFCRKLEAFASQLQCQIYWSEEPPDIIAVPWFVAVVDRKVLGADAWSFYEKYCEEIGETEWCFLIDNGPPSPFAFKQMQIDTPEIQDSLIEMIRSLHPQAARKYKVDFSFLSQSIGKPPNSN